MSVGQISLDLDRTRLNEKLAATRNFAETYNLIGKRFGKSDEVAWRIKVGERAIGLAACSNDAMRVWYDTEDKDMRAKAFERALEFVTTADDIVMIESRLCSAKRHILLNFRDEVMKLYARIDQLGITSI